MITEGPVLYYVHKETCESFKEKTEGDTKRRMWVDPKIGVGKRK